VVKREKTQGEKLETTVELYDEETAVALFEVCENLIITDAQDDSTEEEDKTLGKTALKSIKKVMSGSLSGSSKTMSYESSTMSLKA
jgi:hypothetical protein